jgi:hypothetical protein
MQIIPFFCPSIFFFPLMSHLTKHCSEPGSTGVAFPLIVTFTTAGYNNFIIICLHTFFPTLSDCANTPEYFFFLFISISVNSLFMILFLQLAQLRLTFQNILGWYETTTINMSNVRNQPHQLPYMETYINTLISWYSDYNHQIKKALLLMHDHATYRSPSKFR